jgi:glyceraldehyde-3-phosphate dehydrogenase (NADP+)
MKSGKIDVLAFIGTSQVADTLKHQHPKPHRLRCVLGLEAKNAAIILKDADMDNAVKECALGSLSYNGQRCTAIKILFVHKEIIETFMAKFCDAVSKLKGGMPWDPDARITPLPEPGKTEYLTELINDAVTKGARVINKHGGMIHYTFMSPAIVYPVGPGMRLYSEEQFGPIVPIVSFDDIKEPMDYICQSTTGSSQSFPQKSRTHRGLIDPPVNQVSGSTSIVSATRS